MPRRAVCVCVCFFLFCLFYGGGGGGLGGTPQGWAIRALTAGTHTRGGPTATATLSRQQKTHACPFSSLPFPKKAGSHQLPTQQLASQLPQTAPNFVLPSPQGAQAGIPSG